MAAHPFLVIIVYSFIASRGCCYDGLPSNQLWDKFMHDAGGVNRTKLLQQYGAVCPVQTRQCDSSYGGHPFILQNYSRYFPPCLPCSCRATCIKSGRCCPGDARGYLDYQCVSTQQYPPTSTRSFWMISSCSDESSASLRLDCEMASHDVPVTSQLTLVTYRNKFCAECNQEFDYQAWEIGVECESVSFDVTSLTSIEEIKEAADLHGCRISYRAPDKALESSCTQQLSSNRRISRCNVTGLWGQFDADINWGCENLRSYFREFKNVFCYLCNPGLSSTLPHVVAGCNVTGEWRNHDAEVEAACLTQPSNERFGPFKNIYCLHCNGRSLSKRQLRRNTYFTVTTREPAVSLNNPKAPMNISIMSTPELLNKMNASYINQNLDIIKADLSELINEKSLINYDSDDDGNGKGQVETEDATRALIDQYAAMCGDSRTFHLNATTNSESLHAFPPCGACDHHITCVAKEIACCPDVLLRDRPYTCLRNSQINQLEMLPSVLAIVKCSSDDVDEWLKRKCENVTQSETDMFRMIAVTDNYDKLYRNMYCWACYSNNLYRPNLRMKIEIKATCVSYTDASLFVNSQTMFAFLARHCQVELYVPMTPKKCPKEEETVTATGEQVDKHYIDKCNITGNWHATRSNTTSAILTACESTELPFSLLEKVTVNSTDYRNIFCYICNPEGYYSTTSISTCNATGEWDTFDKDLEDACSDYPEYSRVRPFKNVYCLMCNVGPDVFVWPTPITDIRTEPADDPVAVTTYRSIFSLDPDTWADLEEKEASPSTCGNGTYDLTLKSCRSLYCSKGRILKDGECFPLLQKLSNLHYSLSMGMRVDRLCSPSSDWLYMTGVCRTILAVIEDANSRHSSIEFHSCLLKSSEACIFDTFGRQGILARSGSKLDVSIELKASTTDRHSLEQNLVNIARQRYVVETVGNETVGISRYKNAFNEIEFRQMERDICIYENTYGTKAPSSIPVRELLVCPQIMLEEEEYTYNEETETLSIGTKGGVLTRNEYIQTDNSTFYVCKTDYLKLKVSEPEIRKELPTLTLVYNIFSTACTLVSIVCLLMTLLTYSTFPSLRTLPGKNNMALVASLLCAQSSLQFGLYETDQNLCIFLGVLIHASWLASFCAMNVCSLHMFRVFCSRTLSLPNATSGNKTFIRYILYILGVPVFIVAVNASVFMVISKGVSSGYGHAICFLNNYYSVVFAFVVPAIVIFTSDIVFFGVTFYRIVTSPTVQNSARDRKEFQLYVKLCTITGVTWPLMVVDATLPVTAFSFCVTFLNALQGLFIFVSYVCNRRVLVLCRQRFREKVPATRAVPSTSQSTDLALSTTDSTFQHSDESEQQRERRQRWLQVEE